MLYSSSTIIIIHYFIVLLIIYKPGNAIIIVINNNFQILCRWYCTHSTKRMEKIHTYINILRIINKYIIAQRTPYILILFTRSIYIFIFFWYTSVCRFSFSFIVSVNALYHIVSFSTTVTTLFFLLLLFPK